MLSDIDLDLAVALLRMDSDPSPFLARIQQPVSSDAAHVVLARYFMERYALLNALATLFKMSTVEAPDSSVVSLVRDLMRQGCVYNVLELETQHTHAVRHLLATRDATGMGLRVSALLAERRLLAEIVFVAAYYSRLSARETAKAAELACLLADPGQKPMPSTSQSIMLAPTARASEFVLRDRSMAFECLYLALASLLATLAGDDAMRISRDEDLRALPSWQASFGESLQNGEQWLHDGARGVVLLAWGLFLASDRQQPQQRFADTRYDAFLLPAFELRALAFVRLVVASPEFASDALAAVLANVFFTSLVRALEANRVARGAAAGEDAEAELDRIELLRPRVQLLDASDPAPLPDSLEDLLAGMAACVRFDAALAEHVWADKAELLDGLVERMPAGEEKPYSLRQALLALLRALAQPNEQCAGCCLALMRDAVGHGHRLFASLATHFASQSAAPVPAPAQELAEAWALLFAAVAQTADLAEAVASGSAGGGGGDQQWSTDGVLGLLGCELSSALKGALLTMLAAFCTSPRVADEVARSRVKLVADQQPAPPRAPDLAALLEQREAPEQTYPVTRGLLALALAKPAMLAGFVAQHVWLRLDARAFAFAGERWHVAALCLRVLLACCDAARAAGGAADAVAADLRRGGAVFAMLGSVLQQSGAQLARDVAAARRARRLDWFLASANRRSLTTQRDSKRLKAGASAAAPFWQPGVEQPQSQGLLHFPSASGLLDSGLGEAVAAWLLETSAGRASAALDDGDACAQWRLETVQSCLRLLRALDGAPAALALLRGKVPLLSSLLALQADAETRLLSVALLDRLAAGWPAVFASGVQAGDVAWLLASGGEEDRAALLRCLAAHKPAALLAAPAVLDALAALPDSPDALHALYVAANASAQAAARVERVWEACLRGPGRAWALRGLAVLARTKPDAALAALGDGEALSRALADPALHAAWRAVVEAVPGVDALEQAQRALATRPLGEDAARGALVLVARLRHLAPDDAHLLLSRALCAVADADPYAQPAPLACAAACALLVVAGTRERRAKVLGGRHVGEREASAAAGLSPQERAVAVAVVEAVDARGLAAMERLGYAAVEGASPMLRWVAGAALATLLSIAGDAREFARWAQQRGITQGLAARPHEDAGLLDVLARLGAVRMPAPAPEAGAAASMRVDAPPRLLALLAGSDPVSTMRALRRLPGLAGAEDDLEARATVVALAACANDRAAFEREGLGAKWDRAVADQALPRPALRTAALLYMARRHALPPSEQDCTALAQSLEAMAAEPRPDVKAVEGAALLLHAKLAAVNFPGCAQRLCPSAFNASRAPSPLERLAKDKGGVLAQTVGKLADLRALGSR